MKNCFGIHDVGTRSIPFAVVLLHIDHLGVSAHIEGVYPIVTGFARPFVVNAASGNDDYIAVFTDMKVIVDRFPVSGGTDDYRNMHALVHCSGLDININARSVGLALNGNIGRLPPALGLSVDPDIVGALRNPVQIGNFF